MPNECVFSADRLHRYTLIHRWDELLNPDHGIAWICLNPSTEVMSSSGILYNLNYLIMSIFR